MLLGIEECMARTAEKTETPCDCLVVAKFDGSTQRYLNSSQVDTDVHSSSCRTRFVYIATHANNPRLIDTLIRGCVVLFNSGPHGWRTFDVSRILFPKLTVSGSPKCDNLSRGHPLRMSASFRWLSSVYLPPALLTLRNKVQCSSRTFEDPFVSIVVSKNGDSVEE
ncbi:hypothetical protein BS17DRAFT_548082 [Gyrodon lividus]|nr:hypothetical protein BS17DRAFT_548082 [Gyrodon lividus]